MPTALYGADSWGMRSAERRKVNVLETKCLKSLVGVSRMDRVRNEQMRRRAGIERELASRADQRVLRWFGHMERMDEYRMARRVLMAEVSGGRVRGRPRLGWMDGVRVALGKRNDGVGCASMQRSERVESPCTYVTDRVLRCHFCLAMCFSGPPSGDYHQEMGGMPSHDAVGISCKKGATNGNQGACVKHVG